MTSKLPPNRRWVSSFSRLAQPFPESGLRAVDYGGPQNGPVPFLCSGLYALRPEAVIYGPGTTSRAAMPQPALAAENRGVDWD